MKSLPLEWHRVMESHLHIGGIYKIGGSRTNAPVCVLCAWQARALKPQEHERGGGGLHDGCSMGGREEDGDGLIWGGEVTCVPPDLGEREGGEGGREEETTNRRVGCDPP